MGTTTPRLPGEGFGQRIGFNVDQASPPTAAYVAVDDQLQVMVESASVNIDIHIYARVLLPNGKIVPNEWTAYASTGRVPALTYQSLAEGFLLSLTVACFSAVQSGQTYVRLTLMRGTQSVNGISQVLIAGYPYQQNVLSWPVSPAWPMSYGRGKMRVLSGTTPGAGQEISEVVPSGALWRLLALRFTYASSAAGAPRGVCVFYDDGATFYGTTQPQQLQAVSTAIAYSLGAGYHLFAGAATVINLPGLIDHYLPAGFRIRTTTLGLDPGDQYSAIAYLVEEWLS
jgi:hypothetical protein